MCVGPSTLNQTSGIVYGFRLDIRKSESLSRGGLGAYLTYTGAMLIPNQPTLKSSSQQRKNKARIFFPDVSTIDAHYDITDFTAADHLLFQPKNDLINLSRYSVFPNISKGN